jgi:peptidoglycan hydrolase-like protein with peptidoglycan-binding domain
MGSALLLCSCASVPVPSPLRSLTCKNLPAGDGRLRAIQQALVDRGYDPGPLDGQMGNKTRDALRQFQADKGLPATGAADAASREALGFCEESASAAPSSAPAVPPAVAPSSSDNSPVMEAQRLLTERGYAPGPIDGLMGNRTREALNRFQSDKDLPVTGKPDAQTLSALRSPAPSSAPPTSENTEGFALPQPASPAPTPPEIAPQPQPVSPMPPISTPPSENTDDFALPPSASPMPTPPLPPPDSPASTPPSENADDFALPQPASPTPTRQ